MALPRLTDRFTITAVVANGDTRTSTHRGADRVPLPNEPLIMLKRGDKPIAILDLGVTVGEAEVLRDALNLGMTAALQLQARGHLSLDTGNALVDLGRKLRASEVPVDDGPPATIARPRKKGGAR